MDPISAIIGALIAGATAAAKDVATEAVKDAYSSLKQLIAARYRRKAPLEAVEEAPDSASARDALGGALKETGADRDPEVMKLAENLAAALQALGPDTLRRANIEIEIVKGYRDAIVRGLDAEGSVKIGKVEAERRDAIVENVRAGSIAPQTRQPNSPEGPTSKNR